MKVARFGRFHFRSRLRLVIASAWSLACLLPLSTLIASQPLAKGMSSIDSARWFRIVLERTWTPFILLVLATMAFASYAARVAPKATTALEVLRDLGL